MTFLVSLTSRRIVPSVGFWVARTLVAAIPRKKTMAVDFASLRAFQAIHGHLLVPRPFSFSPDTPGAGNRAEDLGRHVGALRTCQKTNPRAISPADRDLLNQMGFVWNNVLVEKFRLKVEGFVTYRKLYGDFMMPQKFAVPHGDLRWPRALWGLKLGYAYAKLRQADNVPLWQTQYLKEMGVPLDLQPVLMAKRALAALETYKRLHVKDGEKFSVPHDFAIAHDDSRWDPSLWGMHLGGVVDHIRSRGSFASFHDKFRSIGLLVDKGSLKEKEAERIVVALKAYKKNFNIKPGAEFTVTQSFSVPADDNLWDRSVWGMNLGHIAWGIRILNMYADHRDKFRDVGLRMDQKNILLEQWAKTAERILTALQTYRRNMRIKAGREFTVPQSFTVPHDSARWDPSLWGMRLGILVSTIRHRGAHAAYHDKFRNVGLCLAKGPIRAAKANSRSLTAARDVREEKDIAVKQEDQHRLDNGSAEGLAYGNYACDEGDRESALAQTAATTTVKEAVPLQAGAVGKAGTAQQKAQRKKAVTAAVASSARIRVPAKPRAVGGATRKQAVKQATRVGKETESSEAGRGGNSLSVGEQGLVL